MTLAGQNRSIRRETVPVPYYRQQILNEMPWDRTRPDAMRDRNNFNGNIL